MRLKSLELENWMNFKRLEVSSIEDRLFIIGPNASGKSNLLDALRFLRDVALPAGPKPSGGGLQKAMQDRGGISKVRCLNAGKQSEIRLGIRLEEGAEEWEYKLHFKGEGRANNRLTVVKEEVLHDGKCLMRRPDELDEQDQERLTQTALEDVKANQKFRPIAHFLSEVSYLHLVPQLLKFSDLIGGNRLTHDPFGQGFLERIAATPERTRTARLRRIQRVLGDVVPQFSELRFVKDTVTGRPHVEANFAHWRPKGAWQRESQFSDGTLRLIALLWSLLDTSSLLLLEEPELSLNEAVVAKLPELFRELQKGSKTTRQIVVTTHSDALLADASIGWDEIVRLEQANGDTRIAGPTKQERAMVDGGFTIGKVLLEGTRPPGVTEPAA